MQNPETRTHQQLYDGTTPQNNVTTLRESAARATECSAELQPVPGGGARASEDTLTAGVAPRLVIRGERYADIAPNPGECFQIIGLGPNRNAKVVAVSLPKDDAEPLAAFTDYLNTTFPFTPSEESLVDFVRLLSEYLGEPFASLQQRKGGLHGYQKSFDISKTGALFAFGGQHGTALVTIPGSACALIQDWQACYRLFCVVLKGRITRWDGAIDVFDGAPSVDDAMQFYLNGQFNSGGNKPSCSQIGNWIEPDGSGRTFYVGKRKNGKLLRVYEKGKQLGDPLSPWVRWELELHNRDRIIPWEVLLEPGKYLAAAYPCMNWVSEAQERIRTLRRTASISYEHLTFYAQRAYGPLINVMLEVEGSPEKVIERLKRPGIPARLECAGLAPAPLIVDDRKPEA